MCDRPLSDKLDRALVVVVIGEVLDHLEHAVASVPKPDDLSLHSRVRQQFADVVPDRVVVHDVRR